MGVALVTGASRGIGKATAVALASAGFDLVITARTLAEGTGRDDSDVGKGRAIPGSLEATAAAVSEAGGRALPVVADLLDAASLEAAVARTVAEFGRLDVLVNNAVHTGPGSMTRILETPLEAFETKVRANFLAPLVLVRAALPVMLRQGGGIIVNVTSHVAANDPPGPAGAGGWGLAYAASKAALHRVVGVLHAEHGADGIRAYNVDPGHVTTERMQVNAAALGLAERYPGAPPSAPAAAIAWLVTAPEAAELSGQTVNGLKLALERAGHPDWRVKPGR